jgi:hypothetical protein
MTALSFAIPDMNAYPFGVLAWTVKDRLIFWPVLPKSWGMTNAIDHVTLEFPSKRSHLTAYDANGRPVHRTANDMGLDAAWGLTPFPGTGIALWFTLAVQTSTILEQDLDIQRRVLMPTPAEKERRTNEFVRHYQQLNHESLKLPPDQLTRPQYIVCNVYLVTDPTADCTLNGDMFVAKTIQPVVNGWPDDAEFPVQGMKLERGGHQLIFATACPPGELQAAMNLGVPRLADSSKAPVRFDGSDIRAGKAHD